jgi:hypothetical protein
MISESTWFFEQPRLTKPMVVFLLPEREGVINREAIGAVYGTGEKPVNQQPLRGGLFEHSAWCTSVIPDVQASEIPAYPQSFSAACHIKC